MFNEQGAVSMLMIAERRLDMIYPNGALSWAEEFAHDLYKRLMLAADWIDVAFRKRNMAAFQKSLQLYETAAEALFSAYRNKDNVVPEQGNLLEGVG
ncbi:MAG: hypothetical protein PHT33_05630 [bacterium]|nr:hypothetical protein [bacterium]